MDTLKKTPEEVAQVLQIIKTKMPNVYAAVQAKAAEIGPEAFSFVRQGIRGEPYKFYAFEAGHVVGTPFEGHPIEKDIASHMCSFGCQFVCIWPIAPKKVAA
ncbi:MAG: hypothetical protein ACOYB1_09835 [Limnohabitans sp.]